MCVTQGVIEVLRKKEEGRETDRQTDTLARKRQIQMDRQTEIEMAGYKCE